jgi:AAA15 family ATPase/GTPase
MQLSRIQINNFRSLKNVPIDNLKRVNIFMGKNNSGKSSIFHAIYLAKNGYDPFHSPFEDCVFLPGNNDSIEIFLEVNGGTLLHETHWNRGSNVERIYRLVNAESFINNIYYIMADRGIFYRASSISGGKPSDVGLHGEYTNRAMVYIKQNEEEKFTKIRKFTEEIGIGTKNIDNLLIHEGNSQVTFMDPQNNMKFNILLSGFGQNQLLPIIVQAFDAPSGSVLLFEEPEVSLHPGAQRNLLEKFAKFVIEENKQLFLTSHSSYFLETIKRWYDTKNPLLERIALFNVSRNKGVTSVTLVPPNNIDNAFKEFYQR